MDLAGNSGNVDCGKNMSEPSPYNDYKPITWLGRMPVYTAGVIAALLVVGMFATVFLETARVDIFAFAFIPSTFWHGALWQVLTYWLIAKPNFFFAFNVLFFAWFGTDVERYLGRSRFLQLFLISLLTPVVVSSLWYSAGLETVIAGSLMLSICFFVAFATLYPNLELWHWITMKWLAFAGIVLDCMNYLPNRDWAGLSALLAVCAASFAYVRFLQTGADFSVVTGGVGKIFRRKPKFKVVPREASPQEALHESIDPLLDKIAKSGLSSLTAKEKAQLEQARKSLLRKQE